MPLEDCFVIPVASDRFLVSKGTTSACEEFRSWHALVSTGDPSGNCSGSYRKALFHRPFPQAEGLLRPGGGIAMIVVAGSRLLIWTPLSRCKGGVLATRRIICSTETLWCGGDDVG